MQFFSIPFFLLVAVIFVALLLTVYTYGAVSSIANPVIFIPLYILMSFSITSTYLAFTLVNSFSDLSLATAAMYVLLELST